MGPTLYFHCAVATREDHFLFLEWESGHLYIAVPAKKEPEAWTKTERILSALPYEKIRKVRTISECDIHLSFDPALMGSTAQGVGLSVVFDPVTGTDRRPAGYVRPKCFRVTRKVRPTPGHSLYHSMQHGVLTICIPCRSVDRALVRAESIFLSLPYKGVGCPAVTESYGANQELNKKLAGYAREHGLAVMLDALPVGSDESYIETLRPSECP